MIVPNRSAFYTLFRNRLLALPRQRRKLKHKKEDLDGIGRDMKLKQKINDVFKFEAPIVNELDLKTFCKLLKKSCF